MKFRTLFVLGIATVALVLPFSARASLGGDITSVHEDQSKLQGTLQTTTGSRYAVHEIQSPGGIVLREYVGSAGKVFGVAWQGPAQPDLRQVLGAYYNQYVQAVRAQRLQRRGHGPLLIQEPGFVVQVGGHMHALKGRAYVPQSLPAGVSAEEIR